jgi:hypothetical protein
MGINFRYYSDRPAVEYHHCSSRTCEQRDSLMKLTGKRVFTAVTLALGAITVYQVLSKPQPITIPQSPGAARDNAQSFDQKLQQLETPRAPGADPAEVHFTSDEVSAEMAQSIGAAPPIEPTPQPVNSVPTSAEATVAPGGVKVKDYQVKLEGDVARGQFVTQVAGKELYVTLAGRLGSQDGFVTFDPTEFKVGDMSIPVSLVNSALQKKLAEQRDQLKLPDGIASLRVENSELVITQK